MEVQVTQLYSTIIVMSLIALFGRAYIGSATLSWPTKVLVAMHGQGMNIQKLLVQIDGIRCVNLTS